MESFFSRYKNFIVLGAVLVAEVLGLAVQVRHTTEGESQRLIRLWAVSAVTPFEKAINSVQNGSWNIWHNYFYLRGVRAENRALKAQIEQLRLEQTRLSEDANQARRLQALLGFKEQYIQKTLAAQVIGASGSEQSRTILIDKGHDDGVKPDQAVITGNGIVGKVLNVFPSTAQVLLLNDQSSGVGGILEKSRLQGIVKGSSSGAVELEYVMSDEQVPSGEQVLTSGGDGIFPKGLPIGTVTRVSPGHELFLNIRIQPAADLAKLEEVLIVTEVVAREPASAEAGTVRAVDVLAERLPSVPDKPPANATVPVTATTPGTSPAPSATTAAAKPESSKPEVIPGSAKPVPAAAPPPAAESSTTPKVSAVKPAPIAPNSTGASSTAPMTGVTTKPAASASNAAGVTTTAPRTATSQPASGATNTKPQAKPAADNNAVAPKPKPAPPSPAPPADQAQ
jgi:rod shape-determining protein MreC